MKIKKYLNGNEFIDKIKECFSRAHDYRQSPKIAIEDALMSAFAMFQLKYPSLLQYEEDRRDGESNLNRIYKIQNTPSDTRMREIIDLVKTDDLRVAFKSIFSLIQRSKALDDFKFIQDYHLVSSDGTGTFSSNKVHCEYCLERFNKKTGEVNYQHQCLTAALVHPDKKIALPFAPEIIKKEDGFSKNDCELNASKRLWVKFRKDFPKLKTIVLEDGLCANGPHIKLLRRCDLRFIITAKENGNKSLFNFVKARESSLKDVVVFSTTEELGDKVKKTIERNYKFVNRVPLTQQEGSPVVNFLEFTEITRWINQKGEYKEAKLKYAWVTDLFITKFNAKDLVRAGRCRWKIENETFNTLKNQGYNFEHNYGHGQENLSSNFTHLMLLSFLFDQALEGFCELYQKLRELTRTRYRLFETIRVCYDLFNVNSWNHFLEVILCKKCDTC